MKTTSAPNPTGAAVRNRVTRAKPIGEFSDAQRAAAADELDRVATLLSGIASDIRKRASGPWSDSWEIRAPEEKIRIS